MGEFISINPDNPQSARIEQVVEVLRNGGIVIYPTDTVYGMGCDLYNQKAIRRLCQLKGIRPDKLDLSFICYDLSDISQYARQISTPVFKVMRKALPGPFTFILESSTLVPKILDVKKKQVGIRVPAHNIPREIVRVLGNPILTTSIRDESEVVEYSTDPGLIYEKFQNLVEIVIDGGYGGVVASTVVDCTDDSFEIVRQGLGDLEQYL